MLDAAVVVVFSSQFKLGYILRVGLVFACAPGYFFQRIHGTKVEKKKRKKKKLNSSLLNKHGRSFGY